MEVEESFGITIPENIACQMLTVGDLYSYILQQTLDPTRTSGACLSAATFYSLRRQLSFHIDDASSLRPSLEIEATIPRPRRRQVWAQLSRDMDLWFPALSRPSWIVLLAISCVFALTSLAFVCVDLRFGAVLALPASMLIFALTWLLMHILTVPLAVIPTDSIRTYRGLVTQAVAMNDAKLAARSKTWDKTDVWDVLKLNIVEQLGVAEELVTPDANFVADLGCD